MQDVQRLRPINHAVHDSAKSPAIPRRPPKGEAPLIIHDRLSDEYEPGALQAGDLLSFFQPGIQHRVFRKLRAGQYPVAETLDLHGLNARQAKQSLLEFLHHTRPAAGECVHIIHGKGNRSDRWPVIKSKLDHWLRQHERVLSFHSALQGDGGTGAVYVLLRRC